MFPFNEICYLAGNGAARLLQPVAMQYLHFIRNVIARTGLFGGDKFCRFEFDDISVVS
jgi:hypothetical protein